eukprot:TRINITY_DN274_c0_g1_i1.p1 TRINITY_DN274_c0_g1~~TRINITY_DN274_c0_g1_i1.p1  ORF type:complete len:276 (+),score=48.51 TRINITY_DN274_c0_g1_i1:49-876(+)
MTKSNISFPAHIFLIDINIIYFSKTDERLRESLNEFFSFISIFYNFYPNYQIILIGYTSNDIKILSKSFDKDLKKQNLSFPADTFFSNFRLNVENEFAQINAELDINYSSLDAALHMACILKMRYAINNPKVESYCTIFHTTNIHKNQYLSLLNAFELCYRSGLKCNVLLQQQLKVITENVLARGVSLCNGELLHMFDHNLGDMLIHFLPETEGTTCPITVVSECIAQPPCLCHGNLVSKSRVCTNCCCIICDEFMEPNCPQCKKRLLFSQSSSF